MKTKADSDQLRSETSPLEMQPENVDEANLQATLRVLVASGKISAEDVLAAWRLAFAA